MDEINVFQLSYLFIQPFYNFLKKFDGVFIDDIENWIGYEIKKYISIQIEKRLEDVIGTQIHDQFWIEIMEYIEGSFLDF